MTNLSNQTVTNQKQSNNYICPTCRMAASAHLFAGRYSMMAMGYYLPFEEHLTCTCDDPRDRKATDFDSNTRVVTKPLLSMELVSGIIVVGSTAAALILTSILCM